MYLRFFKIEDMKDKHCYVSIHVGFLHLMGKKKKMVFFPKGDSKLKIFNQ
jgi:hypothetical protein